MADGLAAVAARFGAALRRAGLPVGPGRCERFAAAVTLARPQTPRALYWCAATTLVSSQAHIATLEMVFNAVFGGLASPPGTPGEPDVATLPGATPEDLLDLASLMRRITLAVPLRRSRRQRRRRRGPHMDMRSTLRQARRTGGDPVRLIGRAPARRPRKLVVLCDISGSMEPYARAMIQLLYCAAGGARAEVFSFATRLTRLTLALAQSRPALALALAGQTAPDWLGGTRIGESLRDFNNSYARRGMARGAVVVIISDGWDTGDPDIVRREMERLSLVAFKIIWVNPRTKSAAYQPLAGGMAAAWPYCDAVVSAHTLAAVDDLAAALADPVRRRVLHAGRRVA